MPSEILECDDCHMNFRTDSQLRRHKDKFCIGVTGPIEKGAEFLHSQVDRNDVAKDRIKQLEDLKRRKVRLQELQDQEEKGLLKNLKQMNATARNVTKSPDLRQIQEQINKKEVIHRRLGDLETQGRLREAERIEQLNRMVQEQDRRNQRALEDLKSELKDLLRQEKAPPPPPPPLPPPSLPPTAPGQSLDAVLGEIGALRQQYLTGGGQDPRVLGQMADLVSEALGLERLKQRHRRRRRERGGGESRDAELRAIERENGRLQAQLLQLQQQQQLAGPLPAHLLYGSQPYRDTASPRTRDLEREQRRRELEHQRRIAAIQQEMDLLKQQSMLDKFRKDMGLRGDAGVDGPADTRGSSRERTDRDRRRDRPGSGQQPPLAYTEVPALMQNRQLAGSYAGDPLQPAPYDPSLGFYVFLDFVTGLESSITAVRLVAGLYSDVQEVGEPAVLPLARTQTGAGSLLTGPETGAVIGAKQPVPRCLPNPALSLVVEMQAVDGASRSLKSRAWTKIDLFDDQNRLLSGRWKCVLRSLPIRPHLETAALNATPQFGNAALHLRLVNARDVDAQSLVQLTPSNAHLYQFPPQPLRRAGGLGAAAGVFAEEDPLQTSHLAQIPPPPLPPPSAPPPPTARSEPAPRPETGATLVPDPDVARRLTEPRDLGGIDSERTLGFQVDRVKNAEPGIGKVRLTAYYAHSGEVVQSATSPVTCSTSAVKSSFKVGFHVFGQQEASFYDVDFRPDMVAIVRFYLQRRPAYRFESEEAEQDEAARLTAETQGPGGARVFDDEALVAWAALPLMVTSRALGAIRQGRLAVPNLKHMSVHTGTHTLPLFLPPVIDPDRIPFEAHWTPKGWQRYGRASVKLHVFHPRPRPGSLTPSPASTDDEDEPPPAAWIPCERRRPPIEPFYASDGFDVYIDGCRFLPDSVTATKIRARILTRKYEPVGKEIACMSSLDSDIFNPQYNHRQEFREPNAPPSATLLMKLYTLDRFSQKLTLVGFAALNVFVDIGSNNQPATDQGGVQVALNEGAHQCRVFADGPNGVDPLTESWMRNKRVRPVLGASVLVRLYKAPLGEDGRPLSTDRVPKPDWHRLGLTRPRPAYEEKVYLSMSCRPSAGEARILHAHMRRPAVEMREVVPTLAEKEMKTMKEIEKYTNNQLTRRFDGDYDKFNMNSISQYVPQHGFKVALDGAVNLPWHNFTLAHICLNPPGAFYLGKPHAAYDRLVFTETLDLASTNKSPIWQDGWRPFRHRAYHRHMCLVVHMQEVAVTATRDNYKYGLLDQAWTAVPVFQNGFVFTDTFQMPLFAGPPTRALLQALTRLGFAEVMANGLEAGSLRLIEGAAVIVRMCDARREEELTASKDNEIIYLNQDYIPRQLLVRYQQEVEGRIMHTLVPQGKNPTLFVAALVNKFKSLVYKLYEENKIFPVVPPPPEDPTAKDAKDPKAKDAAGKNGKK